MEVFTHDVKKIKGTANKNGLKNAMCKQSLKPSLAFLFERKKSENRVGNIPYYNQHIQIPAQIR